MSCTFMHLKSSNIPYMKNIVGERVRQARLSAKPKITQNDLVARFQVLGYDRIDRVKISRIENNQTPVNDYDVVALAEALKVSVKCLLTGKD